MVEESTKELINNVISMLISLAIMVLKPLPFIIIGILLVKYGPQLIMKYVFTPETGRSFVMGYFLGG